MTVFISGQKFFAEQVLRLCLQLGFKVAGVSCPYGDKYIGGLAAINDIPITPAGGLNADTFPGGVDLGIAAHSFDYIGKRTRYKPTLGWIGFHPSLLPRHRGKSALEWAIRMRDPITGGTIFWLNAGIDRGDIAYQDWCFIDPQLFTMHPREAAGILWRSDIQAIGIRLFDRALRDIKSGNMVRTPQNPKYSTWEPSTDVKDIYRPDPLLLPTSQAIDIEQ